MIPFGSSKTACHLGMSGKVGMICVRSNVESYILRLCVAMADTLIEREYGLVGDFPLE